MNTVSDMEITKTSGFIKKLFQILQNPIFQKIICWGEDGKSIKIWSFRELEAKVLPFVFRHRNYHSFIRQLNMYGFKKQQRTPSNKSCSFVHSLFQKGKKDQLYLIKPTTVKKSEIHLQKSIEKLSQVQKKTMEIEEGKRRIAQVYASFSKFRIIKKYKINRKASKLSHNPETQSLKKNQNVFVDINPNQKLGESYNKKKITDHNLEIQQIPQFVKTESSNSDVSDELLQSSVIENSLEISQKQNQIPLLNMKLDKGQSKLTDKSLNASTQSQVEKYESIEKQQAHLHSSISIMLSNSLNNQLMNPIDLLNYKVNPFTPSPLFYPPTYMPTMMPTMAPYIQMFPQQLFTSMAPMCYQQMFYH